MASAGPRRRTTMSVLVAAVLLLGACTGGGDRPDDDPGSAPPSSAEPTPTAAATPEQPVPRRGQCRRLTWRAALAPTSAQRPVACRARHTAETFFVGRLAGAAADETVAVDSPAVQARAQRVCTRRLPRHLGVPPRDLRLRMAQVVWFTPSVADAEAGADWFRCDVVVVARDRRLLPLPRRTARAGGDAALGMCATAEPGTPRFRRVACALEHSWRAVATVDLPGRRLPTPGRVAELMEGQCRSAARERADDPLDFRWSEERPTREQWRAGRRYGICWVPTGG